MLVNNNMFYSQDHLNKSNNNLNVKKCNSEENVLEDSGYPKSLNDDRKNKKTKYDHVQSKVKLYIEEIKQQQKDSEERRRMEKNKFGLGYYPDGEMNKPIASSSKENLNTTNDFAIDLLRKDNELLKEDNEILKEENRKLIVQNAERLIRIESMRQEIISLQRKIDYLTPKEESTPLSKRNLYQSIFRPPIRNFSQSLLSPFRASNSKGTLGSNSSSRDLINRHNNTSVNTTQSDFVESELNSEIFLEEAEKSTLGSSRKERTNIRRSQRWRRFFCCSGNSHLETVRLQTRKPNKIYPELDENVYVKVDVPTILISKSSEENPVQH